MREQFRFLIQKKGFISMRKLLSCFTLLTLTVSLFAACSTGNADVTPTPEPTATVAPTATPEPTATPTPEPTKKPTATPLPYDKSVTIMNTYGTVLEKSGVCVPQATDLENIYYVKNIKKHYNSISLENEMKPDAIMGGRPTLISIDEAKELGYIIPDNYTDTMVPKLNFTATDTAMKLCSENELWLRFHTLVWHSQTPDWFFRAAYDGGNELVTTEVMDARMEFYIRSVMKHVYDSEYSSCVYAWDVVNEYWNATPNNWIAIYGQQNHEPSFVKLAFEIADDMLKQYGIRDKVSLVFNDFNTYMNSQHLISIIEFVNSEEKLCDAFGMQAHLDTGYPSTDLFKSTAKKFLETGCEVQITELDVTCKNDLTQANYYYSLMKGILELIKDGGNISGITYWGTGDDHSWRGSQKPLLFSMMGIPKPAYYKVLQAYEDAGYTIQQ